MLSDVRARYSIVHDEKISLEERISHDERIEYDEEIAHERILDGCKKGNISMQRQLVISV